MVRARQAFTLVELLVVIGIIALLISILIPALSGARREAQNVKCMANLRGIVQAARMYANANKDYLPTRFRGDKQRSDGDFKYYGPHLSVIASEGGGLTATPYGLGLLVTTKYTQPAGLFCAQYPIPAYGAEKQLAKPQWPLNADPGDPDPDLRNARTSYVWMPHWRYVNPARLKDAAYLKMRDVPREKTLAMDIAILSKNISHTYKNSASWNLAFSDGHVKSVVYPKLVDLMKARELQFSGNTKNAITDSWGDIGDSTALSPTSYSFDDYRDILETLAAGRSVGNINVPNRVKHPVPSTSIP